MSGEIIRIAKTNNYFAINNAVVCDSRLSFAARGLLAYLLSKPDDWEVRMSDVLKEGNIGRDKCYSLFRELVLHGYMHRIKFKKPDGTFSWNCTVYESPTILAENFIPEKKWNGSFVYLLKCGNFYKIGVGGNLRKRISSIQTGNPYKVELIHAWDFIEEEVAYEIEAELHKKYIKNRKQGEWFTLTNKEVKDFIEGNDLPPTRKPYVVEPNTGDTAVYKELKKQNTDKQNTDSISNEIPAEFQIERESEENVKEENVKKVHGNRGLRQIPKDFSLTEEMIEWGFNHELKFTLEELKDETENFINYYNANGKKWKDWVAAWRNWMKNSRKFNKGGKNGQAANNKPANVWERRKQVLVEEGDLFADVED